MIPEYKEEEMIAIAELKKKMKHLLPDHLYADENLFYRFLKARDFNMENAEKMLREHLEWRKVYDFENTSECKFPKELKKYLALNILGHDKDGNSVIYIPTGNIDWIGIYESSKLYDLTRYIVLNFIENILADMKRSNEKTGKTGDKQIYIHNMEHFTFAQATNKKAVLNGIFLFTTYMNNYPETLKAAYVINASMHFYLLYSVLKKVLPSTILDKVRIYADDSYKNDLLEIIEPEELPAFLGGKKADPDGNPLCLTFLKHGKPVPQEFYIHRSKRSLASLPDVQKLTLQRAAFHEIFLEVKEMDSYLEWEFETESRDIGFGLFHEDDEGNKVEIIPIQRINTDEYSETGLYKCDNVGKYIVIFDNTYSFIRKKDIFYKIKVKKEKEEESELIMLDDQKA